ncbi:hypothetical protein SCUCBS95973_004106 [Sporothrix curviconia]|uniref:Aminoglycoside phosphotransferase domain-containing protein n=1 Tax=Sporothrix curviconia TaxID=1260050 RepID=A0ABP0BKX1_9PEZI
MYHHLFLAPVPVYHDGYHSFAAFRAASDWWNDVAALGGQPTEASRNRLHYCLVARLLREAIVPILAAASDDRGFALCHAYLSTQNIFVDSDLQVTGIMDWEFCTAVPPAQLLAAPGMPHPRDLICGQDEPELRKAYRTGFSEEYATMLHRPGGANSNDRPPLPTDREWTIGAAVARFLRLVHLDALQDYHHLSALVTILRVDGQAEGDDGDYDAATEWIACKMTELQGTAEARAWPAELAEDDVPAGKSEKDEKEYFTAINAPERLTAARKLAVCASIRPWQVLDRRLWHWLAVVYKWKEEE